MNTFSVWHRVALLACAGLFAAPVMAQGATNIGCGGGDCPLRLPDTGSEVSTTLNVPAAACSGGAPVEAGVHVHVRHSSIGDLRLVLENPQGVGNVLVSRLPETPGGTAGSCAGDDIHARFNAGGSAPTCSEFIPALGGRIAPPSTIVGLATAASGAWTLRIEDQAAGGEGELVDWSLRFTCVLEVFSDGFED